MSENTFSEKLKQALKSHDVSETIMYLREASKLLLTNANPSSFITPKSVLILGKLAESDNYQIMKYTGHIYTKICEIVPKTDSNVLITISNDILQLCDLLTGTEVAENLQDSVSGILVHLFKHGNLEHEQMQIVQKLLDKKPMTDVKVSLEPILSDINDNNPFGLNRLMDLLSSKESLREQIILFGNSLNPVINALHNTSDREMFIKIENILEHMIYQTYFNIRITGYDESEAVSNLYSISESKDYSKYENVFYTAHSLLNILKPADIFITQNLLKILIRL